jgi:hypothetical protein
VRNLIDTASVVNQEDLTEFIRRSDVNVPAEGQDSEVGRPEVEDSEHDSAEHVPLRGLGSVRKDHDSQSRRVDLPYL